MNLLINIIVWVVLAVPTILEVVADYKEHKKKPGDNHVGDLIMRGIMMVVMGVIAHFINPEYAWWQGTILSIGIFVMFFDYAMGVLLTKNPFYLGTTSQTDSILRKSPWFSLLIVRGLLFVASIITYYQLDKIVGY